MTTLELYERVLLSVPLEERRFFDYLSDTIDEIVVTVPEEYVFVAIEQAPPSIDTEADSDTSNTSVASSDDAEEVSYTSSDYSAEAAQDSVSPDIQTIGGTQTSGYTVPGDENTTQRIDPSMRPASLTDPLPVEDVFHVAILKNILYLAGLGDQYKSEFVRLVELAYLRLWRRKYMKEKPHFIRRARD